MASSEQTPPLARYRILSPKCGLRVSPFQLGSMNLGTAWKDWMGDMTKEQGFKLLDTYYEAGGNFIDTANSYQDEESETWIGEWMAARKNRDQMVIATKYSRDHKKYDDKTSISVNHGGNHARSLYVNLRDSLAKLQTDWIDILYVHWWDYTTSIEEMMDSLHHVVQQGKVLYLGISNAPAWLVSAANTYATTHGKTPFVIYQGRWNALLRDFEREILPMARHFGMALAPWDVMGGGRFTSPKALEQKQREGGQLRPVFGTKQTEEEVKISAALEKVGEELGGKSINVVAIAYVMSKAPYVFPILGGRKVEHLQANMEALELKLSKAQIDYLESVHSFDFGFPSDVLGKDPAETGVPGGMTAAWAGWKEFVRAPTAIGYENL